MSPARPGLAGAMTTRPRAQGTQRGLGAVAASVLVVATVLAGCASAPTGKPVVAAPEAHATPVEARPVGPPAGSQAEAEQFGQQLLATVKLPRGSRQLPPQLQPAQLQRFGGNDVVGGPAVLPFRLYQLPLSMPAAIAFVQVHLPSGVTSAPQYWGKMLANGNTDAVVEEYAGAQARTVPAGIAIAELEYAVVPRSAHTSVMQVSAQVIWYPPRPAVEDFAAATFRAVRLSDDSGRSRTIAKTFTSEQIVGRVVSLLDQMHVSTTPADACSLLGGNGSELELLPALSSQQPVYAESSCVGYQISIGAKPEPGLQQMGADRRLYALTVELLGLRR
jgi:hypothetical protein